MTEEQIWTLIVEDRPREWLVFVDGAYFAREESTLARLEGNAQEWLVEAMVWGMEYGTKKACIFARCDATDERVSREIEVTVTPETGVSTMA